MNDDVTQLSDIAFFRRVPQHTTPGDYSLAIYDTDVTSAPDGGCWLVVANGRSLGEVLSNFGLKTLTMPAEAADAALKSLHHIVDPGLRLAALHAMFTGNQVHRPSSKRDPPTVAAFFPEHDIVRLWRGDQAGTVILRARSGHSMALHIGDLFDRNGYRDTIDIG